MRKTLPLCFALWALSALAITPSLAAPSTASRVELVQSVPTETNLADANLADARDAWVELFRHARRSIDIAQFYLASNPGGPLEPVIAELKKAGSRGVKIRVLVCPMLIKDDQATFDRIKALPNTEVRLLDLSKTHGILHAKYFVVDAGEPDGRIFVGSQNFDWRALIHIHEMGAIVRDPSISSQLESIFDSDWRYAATGKVSDKEAPASSLTGVELTASPPALNPPGIRPSIGALVSLIDHAKRSLEIQTMSYGLTDKYGGGDPHAKWTEIDGALRRAAKRGVSVRMMVSDWSIGHPAIDELKSLQDVHGIRIRIVSIPEARSGHIPYARVIHSKYMIADGKTLWLGTSNWEKNYFYGSRNVALIFRSGRGGLGRKLSSECGRVFSKLWKSPYAAALNPEKEYTPRKAS